MFKSFITENLFNNTVLSNVFWGNRLGDYLIFVLLFAVLIIVIKSLRKSLIAIFQRVIGKSKSNFLNFAVNKLKKIFVPIEYYASIYFSIQYLELHEKVERTIDVLGLIILIYYVIKLAMAVVDYAITAKIESSESPSKAHAMRSVIPAINISMWVVGSVLLLKLLGFDVSAIVAGLGIGGIAVAFAAQGILGDIFSYISIIADKPFEIGDLIDIDGIAGRVTYIGIKTTRLISVTSEQLIISNSDLTKSRIRNYRKIEERRAEIILGVAYSTPAEKLEKVPIIIKNIIEKTDGVRFDRSHFYSYGDFSLNFQTIYWCIGSDYYVFMDKQQHILLEISKEFEKENIEFAYPIRKIFTSSNG